MILERLYFLLFILLDHRNKKSARTRLAKLLGRRLSFGIASGRFFRLALDIYGRNDLKAILDDAGILRGLKYKSNDIISAISRSVGVKPQLVCSKNIKRHLIEIRLCLKKSNIPSYINCAQQSFRYPPKYPVTTTII